MLRLAAPQWLLLLPALALLAWWMSRARLWLPLRAVCLILLILFLAQPEMRRQGAGLDLIVLVDRSASISSEMAASRPEIERLLESNKGADDRVVYVDFASAPVRRDAALAFESPTTETRLRLATEYALAQKDRARAARLLALTDGYSTEDLAGLSEKLQAANVPLDLRLLGTKDQEDFRITRITAPQRVRPGEAFLIEAQAEGALEAKVPYEILSDGRKAGDGVVEFHGGRGSIRVTGRSYEAGARHYEVRLLPGRDGRPGNNSAQCWVEVSDGPNVLLLTAYPDDPLAGVLRAQGIKVEVVSDFTRLHPGMLSGPRTVILNNVPAHLIPADFLASMEFFVEGQGGGLLMTGGKFSFGSGGYFQSKIDPLLPVSMELRQEQRKLAVAMVIVLDRSGSMALGAGPGVTKMDLADEGAARAVELLGPSDAVAVFAVDSEAHPVVPLSQIGGDAKKIGSEVRRIESAGGGIFVYTGLAAAWAELQKATAGQRHIVLFADAADAEEPGDYKALMAKIVEEGATVSVIGLGLPTDSDAAFLQDVAARGNGRMFFNADPSQLPAIFAQETVAIARSAFLKDPVAVVDAGGWLEIASRSMAWPAQVDGYNLSYLKPNATAAAVTGDEYKAPLVAFWQRGAGRAAAISFPIGGDHSQSFRAWGQAGDFEQTLVRWLLPKPAPPGISLRLRVVGEDLTIELLHDGEWTRKLAEQAPRLLIAAGSNARAAEIPWEKIEPGRYAARVGIPPGQWIRGVVQAGGEQWPFGPVSAGVDPEWNLSPDRLQALRAVSKASGGREITDLRDVWHLPREPEFGSIGNWVLVLLLVCFLAEIAVTRWRGQS